MGVHAGNRSRPAYSGQARFQFPPEVTALFKPRRPPPYRPPPRARRRERRRPMSGVAGLVVRFESREDFLARRGGGDRSGGAPSFKTPARKREEARVGAAERVTRRVALVAAARAAEAADAGDGGAGVHEAKRKALTGDAFCTLFVWRLARGTGAAALRADFGVFGRVVRVVVPRDGRGRGRGYAFVEFAAERDVGAAVRGARGRVVDGRRVAVDVERGRTVRGFLPNRLDGPFNSAAAAARRLLGGKSAVAAEARRRLAEGKGAVVVPLYVPPPPPLPPPPPRPPAAAYGGGERDRDRDRGGMWRAPFGGGDRGGGRGAFGGAGAGARGRVVQPQGGGGGRAMEPRGGSTGGGGGRDGLRGHGGREGFRGGGRGVAHGRSGRFD